MKKFAVLLCLFLLCSCGSTKYAELQSESLSPGIYASSDSLKAGRIDLSDKYLDSVKKIVVPPKKRLTFAQARDAKTNEIVVLPDYLKGAVVGSPVKDIKADKNLKDYENTIDKNLRDKEADNKKVREDNSKLQLAVASMEKYRWCVWGFIALVVGFLIFKVGKIFMLF